MLRWMRSGRFKLILTTICIILVVNFFLFNHYESHSKIKRKPQSQKLKYPVKNSLSILDNADPDILINKYNPFNDNYDQVSSEDPSLSDLNQDEDEDDYDKYKVFTATEKLTAATSVIGLTKNNQVIADHYKVFNNPWFSQNMSDMVGSGKQTLQNCEYRSFSNHSFFSVPEFIPEYIKFRGKRPFHIQTKARQIIGIFTFKDCIRQPGVAANEWLNQRLSASIGNKGEFSLDTSRMTYDIDEVGFCHVKSPMILFVVLSQVKDEERRKVVRETWGNFEDENFKVLFITGRDKIDPESGKDTFPIISESDRYNDIIQTNIEEGDDHQSTKQLLASLMWIHERCPLARFIAFTNVETFINIKRFKLLAEKEMFAANRIYGTLLKRMEPNRNPLQDHFVDKASWPWSYLPSFVKEPSFVLSSDLVPRLLMAATTLDMLSVEQVYLTGICALQTRAMRIDVSNFFVNQVPQETLEIHSKVKKSLKLTNAELCIFTNAGAIHQVKSRDQMQALYEVYKVVNAQNITCSTTSKCFAMVEGKCLLYSKKKNRAR